MLGRAPSGSSWLASSRRGRSQACFCKRRAHQAGEVSHWRPAESNGTNREFEPERGAESSQAASWRQGSSRDCGRPRLRLLSGASWLACWLVQVMAKERVRVVSRGLLAIVFCFKVQRSASPNKDPRLHSSCRPLSRLSARALDSAARPQSNRRQAGPFIQQGPCKGLAGRLADSTFASPLTINHWLGLSF